MLKVLEWFVHFGADPDILVNSHPHIGTNKLPAIIAAMREAIITQGGEVHFNSKLTNLQIRDSAIQSIEINNEQRLDFEHVILATGHSARDIFTYCTKKASKSKLKLLPSCVRAEHLKSLSIRFNIMVSMTTIPSSCGLQSSGANQWNRGLFLLYVSWWHNRTLCNGAR